MNERLRRIADDLYKWNYDPTYSKPKPRIPRTREFAEAVVDAAERAERHYYDVKHEPERKRDAYRKLIALRDVRDALPRSLIRAISQPASPSAPSRPSRQLTKGEKTRRNCLKLHRAGLTTKQIAAKLEITRRHVRRLVNQPV